MFARFLRRRLSGEIPAWSIAFRPPEETHTFESRLPSRTEGMWFQAVFETTVSWRVTATTERTRTLARTQREVIRLASQQTEQFVLGDHGRAEADLGCALVERGAFGQEQIRELAVKVSLSADPEDLTLERERERLGQRAEVHTAQHRARMRRVAELRHDVLNDPIIARVWWFEQHQTSLNDIARAGESLDLMIPSAEREGTTSSEPATDPILEAFLDGLEEWEVSAVLERLTTMLEGFERRDLVDRLRERWPSP